MIKAFLFGEDSVDREVVAKDAMASIVVFLVALPLCMGIALACGAPAERGLVTGMVGGLLVGLLAGSPLQVSGPAAGLIVIVQDIFATYAMVPNPEPGGPATILDIDRGLAVLGTLLFFAGLFQIAAGVFKVGQWFRAVAPSVVRGMLAGIGVIIFAGQFHTLVDDPIQGTTLDKLLSLPKAVYKGIFPLDTTRHHQAAYTGLLTIAIIVLWNRFRPDRLKMLPAPLLAVVIASGLANWLQLDISMVVVPHDLSSAVSAPTLLSDTGADNLRLLSTTTAWYFIATLTIIASAETLLCATAVDKLHNGVRTDYDRELWAQGVGNAVCGLLSALPMTGVIVRSSANVEAGGRTRISAVLHGLWLLAFVALLPGLITRIPTTCLAGILVYTGFKLMDVEAIRNLAKYGRSEVVIYFATLLGIVAKDLLAGVVLGIILTLLKIIYDFTHLELEVDPLVEGENEHHVHLVGAATFLRLPLLAKHFEALPPETELHVHFDKLTYIDHACLELLDSWQQQREQTGGKLVLEWHELHERFYNPQKPKRSEVRTLDPAESRLRRKTSRMMRAVRVPEGRGEGPSRPESAGSEEASDVDSEPRDAGDEVATDDRAAESATDERAVSRRGR